MFLNRILFLLLMTSSAISFAQIEQKTDSIKKADNVLDEVVVTGQLEPQSIKKSVFNVRVISKEDIQRLAANNLNDVLNQYLNISIRTSGEDGRSSVSMFGLDSQYFKILVDNVPLVSDTGLGTNVDLSQVNLDDVERIEIIEGSMGVTYGANAVTGVLNIITKRKSAYTWEIDASIQEETVSDEYNLSDKGRHIQSAKISHNFNENWFASIGGNRNIFNGYFGERQGMDYLLNDGLRGYTWLPKDQLVGNAVVGYKKDNFNIFYKFDYFGENVDFYNPIVIPQDNYPFPDTHYAEDNRYISNRYYQNLNFYGRINSKLIYNVSVSYQKQARDIETFNYHLENQQEWNNDRQTYQSKEILYSTGTLSNILNSKKVDLQVGYETVNEKGFYDGTAGIFKDENQQLTDVSAQLKNYDLFAVAEINLTQKFSIRPGIRYSFQSSFDDQSASSLALRYLFNKGPEARLSVGKAYRVPNFDELYTYFVDTNHNVQGNPDLIPEQSTSYEASLKKGFHTESGLQLTSTIAATYLEVQDRISLVLSQVVPTQNYKYLNIDQYAMWNLATTNQFSYKNWNGQFGLALVGISQKIDLASLNVTSEDNFLYSLQFNTNVAYNVPKWNTLFSVYYKYIGEQQQYVATTNANNNTEFVLSQMESYGWMDASIQKSFYKNQFVVTVGARNLLDIQSLQLSQSGGTAGGAHGPSSADVLLGYGRSFFIKIAYNLNFN